jgi:hypothetical protein
MKKILLLIFIVFCFVFIFNFVYSNQDIRYNVDLLKFRIKNIEISTNTTTITVVPVFNFKCYVIVNEQRNLCPVDLKKSLLTSERITVYIEKDTQLYLKTGKPAVIEDFKKNHRLNIEGILLKEGNKFYIQSSKIVNLSRSVSTANTGITTSTSENQSTKVTTSDQNQTNKISTSSNVILGNLKIETSQISPTSSLIVAKPETNFSCFVNEKEKETPCSKETNDLLSNKEIKIYLEKDTKLYFMEMNEATITDFVTNDIIDVYGLLNIYEDNTVELKSKKIVNKSKSLVNLETTLLASIPDDLYSSAENHYQQIGKKLYMAKFSPNGKQVNYAFIVTTTPSSSYAVLNGVKQKEYEEILLSSVTFSPDGQKLAYIAKDQNGYFVVVNGEEGKRYNEILINSLQFSPDSRNIVYVVRNKIDSNKYEDFLVVNGNEGKRYEEIFPYTIFFSGDSKRISYSVKDKGVFSTVYYNLSEEHSGSIYSFFVPRLSEDPYISNLSKEFTPDDSQFQVFGIASPSFSYSRDGKKLAYVAEREGQSWVIVNNQKSFGGYDRVYFITFSLDSEKLAYIAEKDGKKFVVVINKLSEIIEGNNQGLVKEGDKVDWIYIPPKFTPDSKYLYYGARNGKEFWWIVEKLE